MQCTAAGQPIALTERDVARSGLLQQMSDTSGAFNLPFLPEQVRAWQELSPKQSPPADFGTLEAGLKVAEFLQDGALPELAELLVPHLQGLLPATDAQHGGDCAMPSACNGSTPPQSQVQVQAQQNAKRSLVDEGTPSHSIDEISPQRQRLRITASSISSTEKQPTAHLAQPAAQQRALDVLQAIAPHAAAAALAATGRSLLEMLSVLPPSLHGPALHAHCSSEGLQGLHLLLDFAGPHRELAPRRSGAMLLPALRSLRHLASVSLGCSDPADLSETLRACNGLPLITSLAFTLPEDARLWPGFEREFVPLTSLRRVSMRQPATRWWPMPQSQAVPLSYALLGLLPALEHLACDGDVSTNGPAAAPPVCVPTALTWLQTERVLLGDCAPLISSGIDLSGLSQLRHLDLSRCGITNAGATALAAALPALPALTHLNIRGNRLKKDGLPALVRLLEPATSLQSLDAAETSLRDMHTVPLAATLAAATALTHLCLSNTVLGEGGARALAAQTLPALTALQSLDLSENGVREGGMLALVASFSHLRALRRLWLWGNDQRASIQAALEALSPGLAAGAYEPEGGWDSEPDSAANEWIQQQAALEDALLEQAIVYAESSSEES